MPKSKVGRVEQSMTHFGKKKDGAITYIKMNKKRIWPRPPYTLNSVSKVIVIPIEQLFCIAKIIYWSMYTRSSLMRLRLPDLAVKIA